MNGSKIIIWADDVLVEGLNVTSKFEPVKIWDQTNNRRTDVQQLTTAGVPIWEAKAQIAMGYSGDATVVLVRYAGHVAPTTSLDEGRLLDVVRGSLVNGEASLRESALR